MESREAIVQCNNVYYSFCCAHKLINKETFHYVFHLIFFSTRYKL